MEIQVENSPLLGFAEGGTTIARDLRLNLAKLITNSSLAPREALLTLLATATTVESRALTDFAEHHLADMQTEASLIQEAKESAAIMGMLNTYYRFRHMVTHNRSGESPYNTASLRMTSLAKPLLGKSVFEMLAFAVSVLNGCETCISSHEKVLLESGVTTDQVHDLARLAAVVKGLSALEFATKGK